MKKQEEMMAIAVRTLYILCTSSGIYPLLQKCLFISRKNVGTSDITQTTPREIT
jgi:hypothetical protein